MASTSQESSSVKPLGGEGDSTLAVAPKTLESQEPATTLDQTPATQTTQLSEPKLTSLTESPMPTGPVRTDTVTALSQAQSPPAHPDNLSTNVTRITSSAIGPSSDQLPAPPSKEEGDAGSQLQLTLLLTNGARHPFKLDSHYLAKRNVEVPDNDPFNLSVYKLKELILREWREEWEQKPSSPSYIRLISFGRLLDDKSALKDNRFNAEQSNILHMTIKPQDFIEDDEGKGGKTPYSSHPDGTERRSPGCRCIIM